MDITATYDPQADALYVRLGDGRREHAVELSDVVYVDVDGRGRAVGIELLYPSLGVDLGLPAKRFGLEAVLPQIVEAIRATGAPGVAPTVTGGQVYASSTVVLLSAEGTIGAAAGSLQATGQTHSDQLLAIA